MKNIFRNYSNTGFHVIVLWKNRMYRKSFNDDKCGGKKAAYIQAIAFRDLLEECIGKPRTEDKVYSPTCHLWTKYNKLKGFK